MILLLHNSCRIMLLGCCLVIWPPTTLSRRKTALASAFIHPLHEARPHHFLLSSIPTRPFSLEEDDSVVEVPKIASSSLTSSSGDSVAAAAVVLEEEETFSLAIENMKNVAPGNVLATETNTITDKKTKDVLKLWKRRLITFEDAFSVHKLTAVVYTLSSFTLMGTAAYRWLVGRQELFAVVPDYLEPVMWAFCISNLFLCTSAIRMALLYRQNNVASRNAFIGVAFTSLFSAYFLVWASPFAPEQMISPLASKIGFGILCSSPIILLLDTLSGAKDIIDDRRDNRSQDENASYALEYLRYIVSAAWPLPVIASTGYISSVLHDHAYVINVFDQVLKADGFGMQASVFYSNVGGCMAACYGAFLITIRDKMLISKKEEWMGIAFFSVPVLIWTIDVTARFTPFVLGFRSIDL